jgi:tRNA G18 (ribose-2'-O)-methylase SpoU
MLTQCPNPKCRRQFEVPDERAGRNGPCPNCGQVITFRSLEVLRQVERQRERLAARGHAPQALSGVGALSGLLEDVRSLWNVGSAFRTADGAGFSKLYLCGITGCPPRKQIAKTSLGAEDHVPWEYYTGALEILPDLRASGVQVLGLEQTGESRPLKEAGARGLLRAPLCLVVGNEVAGVSAETLAQCDLVCHLPMRGVKASLNVAVAFGIGAYLVREALDGDAAFRGK